MLHVHHGSYATKGYSAVKNCINYWYYKDVLKTSKITEFEELIDRNRKNRCSIMYQNAINSKIKKGLTGEWLIFKNYNGKNYYLCLAKHDEGDEFIFENKIKPCLEQFPELKF